MFQSNKPSAFLPVFSSPTSTQETDIFLTINNFLKAVQSKSRLSKKIESLTDRDIPLAPNSRHQINNLIDLASQDETLSLLKIDDFDEEPWLYQVMYSIILHYNKTIFEKISENLSNLNNNPDILVNLCQNELWQTSNVLLILLEISLFSEFSLTLFTNIIEYYTRLLVQRDTIHILNMIAHITQQLLIRVSEFRLKTENKTQASEILLSKLNGLIQNVAARRARLNPPTKEKQYKPTPHPLSIAGREFITKTLNVLNSHTEFMEKRQVLSSLTAELERVGTSEADDQIIKDLFYFIEFSIRSPKEFSFVDAAHPTLELLRVYYFYDGFYKRLPDHLQVDERSIAIGFQQVCDMLAKSFANIIEKIFITQLTLHQEIKTSRSLAADDVPAIESQVRLKISNLGRSYKLPTIEDVRNLNGQNLEEVANILFVLTVEQTAFLNTDSEEIEEVLFLFESLLVIMPEFFVRYPQIFNRYENIQAQYLLYITTNDEVKRITYQANLRRLMELIEDNMQSSSSHSQSYIEPIFLRLNDLLMTSIKQATRKRAIIELAAHNDWALNRGHPEFRTAILPNIARWYAKIIEKIEENELWGEHLQENCAMRINPEATIDALLKVDISILDFALRERLKNIFDSVFRLQMKIDPLDFCRDQARYKTFLNVVEVFNNLLQNNEKNQDDKTEYLNLLHGFITNTIMRLAQRLQDNPSQEKLESDRVQNFIVDLIALSAKLFKPKHEIEFIMSWHIKLEYIFPSQKFLFDKLNNLLADISTMSVESPLVAKERRSFKPIYTL